MKLVARWQFWVLALDLAVLGSNAPGAALAKEWRAPKGSHVLFVCTGNFYRSRFAEAIL